MSGKVIALIFSKSYNVLSAWNPRVLTLYSTIKPSSYESYVLCSLNHHFFASISQCSLLTLRLLMSYIYGAPILDVSRSHTTTHHSR